MFYLSHADVVPTLASLARKSFLQLQSINPSNPSMWNGYAMLARRQGDTAVQQMKTIEAFDCALQTGLDLDALLGLCMALLDCGNSIDESITNAPEHGNEQLMFFLKKYLERDPYNGHAWHALGIVQHRLGLYSNALTSYTRAASSSQALEGLEWNTLVTTLGEHSLTIQSLATNETALLQKIATLIKPSAGGSIALGAIVQAHLLYRQSKGGEALDLLQELLSNANLQTRENDVVASVGLSMSGLLIDDFTPEASRLATVCKNHLLSSVHQAESTLSRRHYLDLLSVELFERWVGTDEAYLTRMRALSQTSDGVSSSALWVRLSFAAVDSQTLHVSSCLAEYLRAPASSLPSPGEETDDRNLLDSLVGLFKAGPSGTERLYRDAQKLIRAQPWNPQAYVIAGTSILKRMSLQATDESIDEVLHQLLRLLQTGLSLSISASRNEYDSAQLELLTSYCFVRLGMHDQAIATANNALHRVATGKKCGVMAHSVDTDLLEARLLSVFDPAKAISKYLATVAAVSDSGRLVPILLELGGLYEEQQLLDAAINVWKLVASLTATIAAGSDDTGDDASSATTTTSSNSDIGVCFFANLRLSLIHGKKSNVKMARKHIKIAATLVEADPNFDSSTIVAFVSEVLAN
uniref:Uncharacterized protein n=1 Tax=Hyaloperonospora arabidopsidis (strain Emoy2) TaxID=559515 RepID=M4B183_HYAAE